jgi:hypothetical protein
MHRSERRHLDSKRSRTRSGGALTPDTSLDPNLGAVRNLPFIYWRPRFYFSEAPDEDPLELSAGQFPRKPIPRKTHPVFSPKSAPNSAGFTVCPCSYKKSGKNSAYQHIRTGCTFYCKAGINPPRYLYKRVADVLRRTDGIFTFAPDRRLTLFSLFPQNHPIAQLMGEDFAGIPFPPNISVRGMHLLTTEG